MRSPSTSIVPIYVRLAPVDIALLKFLVESYEGVGIVRTLDRRSAIIVLLIVPDFLAVAEAVLDDLARSVAFERIEAPEIESDDWLMRDIEAD
jgi:hypothetical protein